VETTAEEQRVARQMAANMAALEAILVALIDPAHVLASALLRGEDLAKDAVQEASVGAGLAKAQPRAAGCAVGPLVPCSEAMKAAGQVWQATDFWSLPSSPTVKLTVLMTRAPDCLA
jgi:hypothetical protein